MQKMKGISCCGDCVYYSAKKHKCTRGAHVELRAQDHFYDDCPLPDAVPVVYGRWIWEEDGMDFGIGCWHCSNCRTRPETTWETMKNINPVLWNGSRHCPNCGADMREING